jgi:hypothetical protein
VQVFIKENLSQQTNNHFVALTVVRTLVNYECVGSTLTFQNSIFSGLKLCIRNGNLTSVHHKNQQIAY